MRLDPKAIVLTTGSSQSSLPTRLWKSTGQGFSNLLQGAPENGSVCGSSSLVNGITDHEENGQDIKKW